MLINKKLIVSAALLSFFPIVSHGSDLEEGNDPFHSVKQQWSESSRLTIEYWMAINHSTVRYYVSWHNQAKIVFDHELGIIHVTATGPTDKLAKNSLDNAIFESLAETDVWDFVSSDNGEKTSDIHESVLTAPVIISEIDGVKVASKRFYMVSNHIRAKAEKYIPLITKYSSKNNLSPELVAAVIEAESYFNPRAISSANALGLMQLVPSSGGRHAMNLTGRGDKEPSPRELFDPETNISLGTAYLAYLHNHYGFVIDKKAAKYLSLAAYNWGSKNVDKKIRPDANTTHQQVIYRLTAAPKETREYVKGILKKEKNYASR